MIYGYYSYYGFIVTNGFIEKEFSSEDEARESYPDLRIIYGPEELFAE